MGTVLERAVLQGVASLLVLVVFLPLALLLAGHLLYILAETIRELRKK